MPKKNESNKSTNFEDLFPLKDGENCGIDNREAVIDCYLQGEYAETEMDAFDEHILYCRECYQELNFKKELREVIQEQNSQKKSLLFFKLTPKAQKYMIAASFTVLVLYGTLWLLGQQITPATFEIASIEKFESRSGVNWRGAESISAAKTDYEKGMQFLGNARKSSLGLFPHYDKKEVAAAIPHLTAAFQDSALQKSQRAKIAFFLAKAYLMNENATEALAWLESRNTLNTLVFEAEANNLKQKIEKIAK